MSTLSPLEFKEIKRVITLKVKEVAQSKGISQGKLSRIADVDVKTVRRVLRNPSEVITIETLDKLANALQVHPCELIEYTPNSPIPPTKDKNPSS